MEGIVRVVRFHGRRSRQALCPAAPTIESCLTDLAGYGHVAAATQNQARHALVCLDTRVLTHVMAGHLHAARADTQRNGPVVMTRDEVTAVSSRLDGTPQLLAKLLDGSGWRLMEAVRLRVKDLDVPLKPQTVHSGTSDQDRCTPVPTTLTPGPQNYLAAVQTRPQQDATQGHGAVSRPHALARTSPPAAKAWGWPSVFPARNLAVDPRAGVTRGQHVDSSISTNAIKVSVRRAGLTKTISAHTLRPSFATPLHQRGPDIRTLQHRRGHHERATTMIDTHLLHSLANGPAGDIHLTSHRGCPYGDVAAQ